MNVPLLIAAVLATTAGIWHSYGGERMVLIPLFGGELSPNASPQRAATIQTLIRFSWHFFTVVVWSVAVLFLLYSTGLVGGDSTTVRVLAVYWAVFAVAVLVLSRGHHLAWLIGSGIAVAAWLGTV